MKLKQILQRPFVLGALLLVAFVGIARVATVDQGTNVTNLVIDGTGIYDSNGTLRWAPGSTNSITGNQTVSGNLTISNPSELYYGAATTAVSTATTSGSSQGPAITGFLQSGSATPAVEGSALIFAPPVGINGVAVQVSSATSNISQFAGIAVAAASTGAVVNVYDRGWVLALTTGTVAPGALLQTSSLSAGYLEATTLSSNTVVGIALANGNSAGGLTRIKIFR